MNCRFPVWATLLTAILTTSGLRAEAPKPGTAQSFLGIDPSMLILEPTAPLDKLIDAIYDYEVYSAPDVSGQTEFVVVAEFADDGQWDYVHRYEWTGSPDRGMSKSDRGVWKFTTWWNARQAAENLLDSGEITDYEVIEQAKEPQWTYEDTFDTRAQAEDFADEFEAWSQEFGVPHITKIVQIGNSRLQSATRTR